MLFWLAPIYAMIWEYAYPRSITPYATYRSRKLAVWRRRCCHFLITITAGVTYPHARLVGCAAGVSIRSGQTLWICWIYAGVLDGAGGDCAVVRSGPRRGHPVGSVANSRRYPGIEVDGQPGLCQRGQMDQRRRLGRRPRDGGADRGRAARSRRCDRFRAGQGIVGSRRGVRRKAVGRGARPIWRGPRACRC